MHLRVTLITPDTQAGAPPRTVDLGVEADGPVPFGTLRQDLLRAAGHPDAEVLLGGRPIRADEMVGEPPLLDGLVLSVHPGTALTAAPAPSQTRSGLVTLSIVGGHGAGRVVRLPAGTHTIGRASTSAIRLDDPSVSRTTLAVEVSSSGVTVQPGSPTNPVTLEGRPLGHEPVVWHASDLLRVGSTTLRLGEPDVEPALLDPVPGAVRVLRGPRASAPEPGDPVVFPEEPPTVAARQRLPLLVAVVPLVASGVLALVLDSPYLVLFALMTPVLVVGQWWSDRRTDRRGARAARKAYLSDLDAAHDLLRRRSLADVVAWRREHPCLPDAARVVGAPDRRLWERRPADLDWGIVRVGSGEQCSRVATRGGPHDTSASAVPDAPVTIDLFGGGVTGMSGQPQYRRAVAGAAVAQLLAWHSPARCGIAIIADSHAAQQNWGWATRSAHTFARGDPEVVVDHLVRELDRRRRRAAERCSVSAPILVVVDLEDTASSGPAWNVLLEEGPAHGIVILQLAESPAALSDAATTTVHVLDDGTAVVTCNGLGIPTRPDLPDTAWLDVFGRTLAPLRDGSPASVGHPPDSVGFTTVSQHLEPPMDPTVSDDIIAAWHDDVTQLPAAIGMDASGVREIDLVAAGPHALVGGTTGSGKSQFLRTWVTAMATRRSPARVAFILIDYKGGSAFTDCADLPHTVGLVTDLDEHLTARALTSLAAEVKRRERLFESVGVEDLLAYEAARGDRAPLPRLVIVVDEFRVLAEELPDFVRGLVRLTAVGRSLGIHLILATQRPAGAVTAVMRTNISLRVALRVRDVPDSHDVIEGPEAAEISVTTPGRAWLRASDGDLVSVQTADTSTPHVPAVRGPRLLVRRLAWNGAPTASAHPLSNRPHEDHESELVATGRAIAQAARALRIPSPTSPWLPALPEVLTHLPSTSTRDPHADKRIRLGLADEPRLQRQRPWSWHLDGDGHLGVCGAARTGRTSTLRTLVIRACGEYSPAALHVHVLTSRPEEWTDLAVLPHVGSVTGTRDPARLAQVVRRLASDQVSPATTTRLVIMDGWEAVDAALESPAVHDALTDPLALMRDGLGRGVRVVVSGGRALLGGGRVATHLSSRIALAFNDSADLALTDVPLSAWPTTKVPGRGLDTTSLAEVQILEPTDPATTAHLVAETIERWRAVTDGHPWRILPLPDLVALTTLTGAGSASAHGASSSPGTRPSGWQLGVGGDTAAPLGVDPGTDLTRFLVLGPPGSGRSSTLALLLAHALHEGRACAVISRRPSILTEVARSEGVLVIDPVREADAAEFVALRRAHRALVVLVDDAERTMGTPVEAALHEVARLSPAASAVVAVAADLNRVDGLVRGLVPETARDGNGVILWPEHAHQGDVLGTRVDPVATKVPGRGSLVRAGRAQPIQVAQLPSAAVSGSSPGRHAKSADGPGSAA